VNWLESKVPPPLVTAAVGLLMWGASAATPSVRLPVPFVLAAVVAIAGLTIEGLGGLELIRRRTTVNPLEPCDASNLVTTGVYRLTRNPIYIGDLLILIGWGLYLASPVALVLVWVFVPYLDRFQIVPEERALGELFGPAYQDYRARVRRWV
jgi:protein-S-isoprenylcysteine O-methyltransferase Ste14